VRPEYRAARWSAALAAVLRPVPPMPAIPLVRALGTCTTLAALAACGLPRDAHHTLDRVRGGELRVGVSEHPPWASMHADTAEGIEPRLVAELARELGARPVWRRGAESELLEALAHRDVDIVVGGLTDDSPWKGRVAFTRPHFTDTLAGRAHVLAVSAGENAFLVRVERFLEPRERMGAVARETAGR